MKPILFKLGPIPVYSFGLMVAIAFLIANWLFTRESRKRGWNEQFSSTITLLALIGGIIGAKLFHLLEYPELLRDPLQAVFSGEGLTFYGGLFIAAITITVYARRSRVSILELGDALAPALILAYGIGRVGCHLAGDGDYGIPTKLPWATSYRNGTVPTLAHLNPELREKYIQLYPDEPVPYDIKVHPTPIYETIACIMLFAILYRWQQRTSHPRGWVFGMYMIMAGTERMLVEFLRLNPLYWGFSQAQWLSLLLIVTGFGVVFTRRSN